MTKKPILYEAACIFSIIGGSIGFISMALAAFFFKPVTAKITLMTNITTTEHLNPIYFALLMTAFSLSLAGAIKLYRMQRAGIWFYLPAQAVVLFLPVIWLGTDSFSVTNAIFTLIFSGVYLFHFRILS